MSAKPRRRRKNRILIAVVGVFVLYFAAVIWFSFSIDPFTFLQEVAGNRILLGSLLLLFTLMLLLVAFNLFQIFSDRLKRHEGSRFRLRLTVFFLTVTLIPVVPVALVSNNVISSSINMWFVKGVEEALVEALDISKELYNRLSQESVAEWREATSRVPAGQVDPASLRFVDGVYRRGGDGELIPLFLKDPGLNPVLTRALGREDAVSGGWKRVALDGGGEVLVSPAPAPGTGAASLLLVRRMDAGLVSSTGAVSSGLQNYRTLKVARRPVKGVVLLVFAFISLPFLLLAIYVSLTISREVTGPIRELAIATRKVAEDQLDFQIEADAKDEIRQLITSFNDMTRELRVNRELLKHSERFAAWQEIARKIAHEIKNPLTPIKLSAERILRMYSGEDRYAEILAKGIRTIITEVENINTMVNEFSRFTRFPETQLGRHNVIDLIEEVTDFMQHTCPDVSFEFYHPEKEIHLRIDRMQIRRALLNIVYNGISAMHGKGTVTIECYPSVEGARIKHDRYIIAVTDSGTGIAPEIRDRIFDPYVSKSGSGSGLGLAIVDKIVLDNRGRIWFESVPGRTTFYMEFEKA